jgi:hypothetical protein
MRSRLEAQASASCWFVDEIFSHMAAHLGEKLVQKNKSKVHGPAKSG